MSAGAELLGLEAASELAGKSASQLRRAARRGTLPGAVRHGGRWRVTREGALAYREAERGPGRPASAGLEVEGVSTFPDPPVWRARIDAGEWSVSDTRAKAIKAAHAAERKRRLIEAQRPELARWRGAARGELVPYAGLVVAGARVVVAGARMDARRAVVLEVSRSGRVTAAMRIGDRVRVVSRPAAELLTEAGR